MESNKKDELLSKIKLVEYNVNTDDKLVTFNSLIDELKSLDDESLKKVITKYEEKANDLKLNLENKQLKEKIVEEAQQLLTIEELEKSLNRFDELKQQFYNIGYAGKNEDERLAAEFKAISDVLQERRIEINALRKQEFIKKQTIKEEIVKEAKKIAESNEFKETSHKFNELFDRWKEIGYAGKDIDQKLWNEFYNARETFKKRRDEFFKQRTVKLEENEVKKQALIAQAHQLADLNDYSNEIADKMKQLDIDWRAIGHSLNNDELWDEFNNAKDRFWVKRNAIIAEKQKEFKVMISEVIERKEKQISDLTNQLLSLKQRIGSVRDDKQIEKMQLWMSEKEIIIKKIQDEVSRLSKKIANI